jgi:hypothetical protein
MSEWVWATDTTWVTELDMLKKDQAYPAESPLVRRFPKNFTNIPPLSVVQAAGGVTWDDDGHVIVPETKSARRG